MTSTELHVFERVHEDELEALAVRLQPLLRAGDMVLLDGNLGMGKSTFARACVRAGIGDRAADVPSPTFTIAQSYVRPDGTEIWHTDLYRLEGADDVYDLGFEDVMDDTIFLVEWPDRLPADWQDSALRISLSASSPSCRRVAFLGDERWAARLHGFGDTP